MQIKEYGELPYPVRDGRFELYAPLVSGVDESRHVEPVGVEGTDTLADGDILEMMLYDC